MFKIAVCDDNLYDANKAEELLLSLKLPLECDVYYDARELCKKVVMGRESYQLFILDIEMPGMSGMELAKSIRAVDNNALLLFLTSYEGYALEAFDYITFNYLLKPITEQKLRQEITKAMDYLLITRKDFFFHYRKDQFRIPCEAILYFEKIGRHMIIHTTKENYQINMTTKKLWEQLDAQVFVHIHSALIINLKYIREIRQNSVCLETGEELPLARAHKQEVRKSHLTFMKGMM